LTSWRLLADDTSITAANEHDRYNPRWNDIIKRMFGNKVGTSMDYPNLYRKLFAAPDDYTRRWIKTSKPPEKQELTPG
jgi:hypothetical protein